MPPTNQTHNHTPSPSDPYPLAIVPTSIPPSTHAIFSQSPWALSILTSPDPIPIETTSRGPPIGAEAGPEGEGRYSLMRTTFATKGTFRAVQTLYTPPSPSPNPTSPSPSPSPHGVIETLYSLGPFLNGHPSILHGGIVSLLLDEAMGMTVQFYARKKVPMTAWLRVEYKKPVRTPGVVSVKTGVKKVEGRKVWMEGVMEGEEGVCAVGESFWVLGREGARL